MVFAGSEVGPLPGVENLFLRLQDARGVPDALGAPLAYRPQGQDPLDVERIQLVGVRRGLEQLAQASRQPPEWATEADRGNLSAEAVRALAGMTKERQAEMHAAMEPWRRTKRELSDYVRSEGKVPTGPDGRIAKAARLVADFLESPSAADLSLLREMALMTAPYADAGTDARKRRRRASGPKSSK